MLLLIFKSLLNVYFLTASIPFFLHHYDSLNFFILRHLPQLIPLVSLSLIEQKALKYQILIYLELYPAHNLSSNHSSFESWTSHNFIFLYYQNFNLFFQIVIKIIFG
ncbi:hypothetical protein EDEG_02840 [Edhazardia aedis USNM 41457]|uniref:Uncharacterized protein n=1 Tax=Edhazardia aedis (strain USNM 41457) TaxID=1003232 RepID=J9DN19_EDHAE|nr:hypothetical protein EDEG_02840 [Edhazardia aedis USNM 41457]|eukprot:EJW02762.1 hypothetical protein EDEG_02840 [Edhazardia aedis USNM 41457]